MKRSTKIILMIAAVVAALWGALSVASNAAAASDVNGAYKVVLWYMILNSLLFVFLAVVALLRLTVPQKTNGLQKGLFALTSITAVIYCVLLVVNVAPQIPAMMTLSAWKQVGWVMEFLQQVLYLIGGVLVFILSTNVLRGKTERVGELAKITAVCTSLLLIPYGLQFFGDGLAMVMSPVASLIVALLTVCQAGTVYGAFCPIEE